MSQWIWLAFFLFSLYFLLVTVYIPLISNAFKARQTFIGGPENLNIKGSSDESTEELGLHIKDFDSKKSSNSSKLLADSRKVWSSASF